MASSDNPYLITGQYTPAPSTVYPSPPAEQRFTPTAASRKELIERYYLQPLEAMAGDQAFICLSICFLLYEKYLRRTGKLKKGEKFHQTSAVWNQIGSDLGIKNNDAFLLWRDWRNGLLHAGMPFTKSGQQWELDGQQSRIVTQDGTKTVLNPWLFRDKVVNKVRNKKEIWSDVEAPLMLEYRKM